MLIVELAGTGGAGIFSGAITIMLNTIPLHKRPLFRRYMLIETGGTWLTTLQRDCLVPSLVSPLSAGHISEASSRRTSHG